MTLVISKTPPDQIAVFSLDAVQLYCVTISLKTIRMQLNIESVFSHHVLTRHGHQQGCTQIVLLLVGCMVAQ
jgi:hypothetical protein